MALRLARDILVLVLASSLTRELCIGTALATQWRDERVQSESPPLETVRYDPKRQKRHGVELNDDPFVLVELPRGVTRRRPGYHLLLPPGILIVTVLFALAATLFILKRRPKLSSGESKFLEDTPSEDAEDQPIPQISTVSEAHHSGESQSVQSRLQQVSLELERLKNTRELTYSMLTDAAQRDDGQSKEIPPASDFREEFLKSFTALMEDMAEAVATVLQRPPAPDAQLGLLTVLQRMKCGAEKIASADVVLRLEQLASDLSGPATQGDAEVGEVEISPQEFS